MTWVWTRLLPGLRQAAATDPIRDIRLAVGHGRLTT